MATDKPRPLLRTSEECFEAGVRNAREKGWKLSPERYRLLAEMVRPYIQRDPAA